MKINFLSILFFAAIFSLHAQQIKGVSVAPASQKTTEGKTYALIVGISKYKNPSIPQLQFADKDAFAFYEYLKSTGVDSNNIILLLNENAKSGEIWTNVDYITSLAKKGDKVFIYFSGHGDMESHIITQDAYLLPYDAPKVVYASGAISILLLKGYLATLSANGVQVVFITDACHSGNLAGGREGMEATATVLKDKWKDEVKILSCQPGELSLEGKQWGNGRGLFSYELINGMAGLADKDKDGKVSLYELNLYLSEKVHEGASPMPQHPMLFGNMESVVSSVDTKILSKINLQQSQTFAAIDVRGFDESLISKLNDSTGYYYKKFKEYLGKGVYREDNENTPSAYYYLTKIPDTEQTHLLVTLMKRNLCAAIMNSVTKFIDLIVQMKVEQVTYEQEKIESSMELLHKILGEDKLLHLGFLSKSLALQALNQVLKNRNQAKGKACIDKAIEAEPGAAYLYFIRGNFCTNRNSPDSIITDMKKTIALSPDFIFPYSTLAMVYSRQGHTDSAFIFLNKLLQLKNARAHFFAYGDFNKIFKSMGMKDSADHYLKNMTSMADTSNDLFYIMFMGRYFVQEKDFGRATKYYLKSMQLMPDNVNFQYDLACCYSMTKDKNNALIYFEKSLVNGYRDFENIQKDTDLDFIKTEKEFKVLMKKYFPDKFKK